MRIQTHCDIRGCWHAACESKQRLDEGAYLSCGAERLPGRRTGKQRRAAPTTASCWRSSRRGHGSAQAPPPSSASDSLKGNGHGRQWASPSRTRTARLLSLDISHHPSVTLFILMFPPPSIPSCPPYFYYYSLSLSLSLCVCVCVCVFSSQAKQSGLSSGNHQALGSVCPLGWTFSHSYRPVQFTERLPIRPTG